MSIPEGTRFNNTGMRTGATKYEQPIRKRSRVKRSEGNDRREGSGTSGIRRSVKLYQGVPLFDPRLCDKIINLPFAAKSRNSANPPVTFLRATPVRVVTEAELRSIARRVQQDCDGHGYGVLGVVE